MPPWTPRRPGDSGALGRPGVHPRQDFRPTSTSHPGPAGPTSRRSKRTDIASRLTGEATVSKAVPNDVGHRGRPVVRVRSRRWSRSDRARVSTSGRRGPPEKGSTRRPTSADQRTHAPTGPISPGPRTLDEHGPPRPPDPTSRLRPDSHRLDGPAPTRGSRAPAGMPDPSPIGRPGSARGRRARPGGEAAEEPGRLDPLFRAIDPARLQRLFDRAVGLDSGELRRGPGSPRSASRSSSTSPGRWATGSTATS